MHSTEIILKRNGKKTFYVQQEFLDSIMGAAQTCKTKLNLTSDSLFDYIKPGNPKEIRMKDIYFFFYCTVTELDLVRIFINRSLEKNR